MFVLTLVQSRTHVDTVQTVSNGLDNSTYIRWSHMVKVLGLHVTFVRRNSAEIVILKPIQLDVMKVWSRMFAVNVQSVSVQNVKWDFIIWFTQTQNVSIVVCVIKVSNTLKLL